MCPLNLQHGLFITTFVNSIDPNPNPTTPGTSALQRMATSLNHRVCFIDCGNCCGISHELPQTLKLKNLPKNYTNLKSSYFPLYEPMVNATSSIRVHSCKEMTF